MVQRLAKGVLPPNTIIQKDAITAMSKGATVFVNYLSAQYGPLPLPSPSSPHSETSTEIPTADKLGPNSANDNTRLSSHKTITPKDVMDALREIEFDAFLPRLEKELSRYSEVQTDKRNSYRRKAREEKLSSAAVGPDATTAEVGGARGKGAKGQGGEEEERARKRVRRGAKGAGEEMDGDAGEEEGGEEGDGGEDAVEEGEGDGEDEAEVEVEDEEEGEKADDEEERDEEEEVDEQLEQELEDEALDNGEDSD